MRKTSLNKIKEAYIKEKEQIIKSLRNQDHDLDLDGDIVDQIQGMALYNISNALVQRQLSKLKKIEDAIIAVDNGTINNCNECDDLIGEKRLMAFPGVRTCIECAESSAINKER